MYGRMMRMGFALLVLLMGSNGIAVAGLPTTNDVDWVFSGIDARPLHSLWNRCEKAGLRDLGDPQSELREYLFDKFLTIPIGTNTFSFSAKLANKPEVIEELEDLLGMKMKESHLRKILVEVSSVQPICTNNLVELREQAMRRDVEKWGRAVNNMGKPYPNFRRYQAHRQIVREWNKAVVKYRNRLLAFVCRKYEEIHADIPEKERREALKAFLQEYGFSM